MRYQHTMVSFNEDSHKVYICETKTDKAGINNAIELIKNWQLTLNNNDNDNDND